MRMWLMFFLLAGCLGAEAHIGSPNIFLEDKAGEYAVRVVIRPPDVVPGLAEITVRVQGPVQRVTVLPVFWRAGREGAPPADDARLVRGETNLYSAQLWLMKPGAYSVDVTVEGPRGKGTLVVPVNSMATNTRPMSRSYGILLSALGMVLCFGALKIAGAIFGESSLDPGALQTKKDRWRGRAAMGLAAVVLSIMVLGGKKWWDFEDRNYRNNALYHPLPVSAQVRAEQGQPILKITVDSSGSRGRWTPLIPDHGKLMHLFLVREGEPSAFAHLHPVLRNSSEFEAPLPPLPAGQYHVYADVTHEDGFTETLIATAEIPPATPAMQGLWLDNSTEPICSAAVAQKLATSLAFPPDPDDSWQMATGSRASLPQSDRSMDDAAPQVANISGGYKMIWENPQSWGGDPDASLRFKLLSADDQPVQIEPYMGMFGHAVVRRQDGAVFAHVHPVGTFSMAARQFFIEGKPTKHPTLQETPNSGSSEQPLLQAGLHGSHTNQGSIAGEISFPYTFPKPGSYRLWVQMKSKDRILTGVFDTTVAATK